MAWVEFSVPPSLRSWLKVPPGPEGTYSFRGVPIDVSPQWWVRLVDRSDELAKTRREGGDTTHTLELAASDPDYLRRSRKAVYAWDVRDDVTELQCRRCRNRPRIRTKKLIAMAKAESANGGDALLV